MFISKKLLSKNRLIILIMLYVTISKEIYIYPVKFCLILQIALMGNIGRYTNVINLD